MEIPTGTQCHFSQGLLLSGKEEMPPNAQARRAASVLALWVPQGSWAALRIQKIPEQPQKNQDVLLSVQGIPDTFQDFIWYRGKETDGGTRLFTYIPDIQRPQRDGIAMEQRDIVGFPNGSMLLRDAQPRDSGTYHVEVHINPSSTMRAKTEVQVLGPAEPRPCPLLPAGANPLKGSQPGWREREGLRPPPGTWQDQAGRAVGLTGGLSEDTARPQQVSSGDRGPGQGPSCRSTSACATCPSSGPPSNLT
ncbi:carcinoembryonic antigen-related cell adhesion molecule 19 isoform X4 [Myotis myotis]|uniref:carcinoembryonic antigen-related cell adhesion molecule 19 isoform X4 n=1 Tax=Myotis myotis TaxID=51298 RepID=UPI00174CF9DE|nr:carcinoembryonic antigen-related cell adhesion molecule 19 isoform X4 [Myotis myotis]